MSVNRLAREPRSPFEWLNAERCAACGQRYEDYVAGVTWQDGLDDFRSLNQDDGFKSRGPILWLMRCRKLTFWIEEHRHCDPEPF